MSPPQSWLHPLPFVSKQTLVSFDDYMADAKKKAKYDKMCNTRIFQVGDRVFTASFESGIGVIIHELNISLRPFVLRISVTSDLCVDKLRLIANEKGVRFEVGTDFPGLALEGEPKTLFGVLFEWFREVGCDGFVDQLEALPSSLEWDENEDDWVRKEPMKAKEQWNALSRFNEIIDKVDEGKTLPKEQWEGLLRELDTLKPVLFKELPPALWVEVSSHAFPDTRAKIVKRIYESSLPPPPPATPVEAKPVEPPLPTPVVDTEEPVPEEPSKSYEVALLQGAVGTVPNGSVTFTSNEDVAQPNYMGIKTFKPTGLAMTGNTLTVTGAETRTEFVFTVGERVKAYGLKSNGKRGSYIPSYDDMLVTAISPKAVPVPSEPTALPPATVPAPPPVAEEPPKVEVDPKLGVALGPVTPSTIAINKLKVMEANYKLYAEKAEKFGFQPIDLDSMKLPDSTMVFGTVQAVRRHLINHKTNYPTTNEPARDDPSSDVWHMTQPNVKKWAVSVPITKYGDDTQMVDVLEIGGLTRVDTKRVEVATKILGNDVTVRVVGAQDSPVIFEADGMAVLVSPATLYAVKP